MASLACVDGGIAVRLSFWESLGALHRGVVIPADVVTSVDHVGDPWPYLRGVRLPGTGIPRMVMLGTLRYRGGKDLCAIYRSGPASIITCSDWEFTRVIVSGPEFAWHITA